MGKNIQLNFDDVKAFVRYLCDKILKIEPPDIKELSQQEMSNLGGSDTIAAYYIEKNCVYIIRKKEYVINDMYYISHELRHVWQNITNADFYFGCYNQDAAAYSSNPAEIDANAFACIAIAIVFNIVPRRNYNDQKLQKMYETQLHNLKIEYDVDF